MSKFLSELILQYTGRYVPPADALFVTLVYLLGCLVITFVGFAAIPRSPTLHCIEAKKRS